MIGLLQILIGLACVLLVMKAIAITQAGLSAPPERRHIAMVYAGAAWIVGLGGALAGLYLLTEQAALLSELTALQ